MPDGRRRSREGWADSMEAGPANPAAHVHRLPTAVRVALVGLVAAMFLLLVAVGLLSTYVYQQQQYIQGKGEQRDRENARLEETQRQGICDLLDQLPEGGLLQRPREKYGCGPGIPLDQLSPDERAQLSGHAEPTTAPAAPGTPAPRAAPGPTPPPQPALPESAAPSPAAPSRPPLIDLGPVTNPVCDAAIVCF